MTFSSGNTTMDTLIDKIADDLIATGAWSDADPAGRPAGAAPARRAVQHITDGQFVSMERVVAVTATYLRFNEVRVQFSSTYDAGTSTPTGTVETTGLPCEAWQTYGTSQGGNWYWSGGGSGGSGDKAGQFWMWLDDEGFTVLATWSAGGGHDYTSFLSVERNTTKEYPDGYTNFFVTAWTNSDPEIAWDYNPRYVARYFESTDYGLGRREYIRPFNVSTTVRDYGVELFEAAYRSDGNSKIYFHFPHFSNNLDTAKRTPIAQTRRWFVVALSQGLADGDLVDWVDGAVTKTYLVKTLQSPDSTAYLAVAMRQG